MNKKNKLLFKDWINNKYKKDKLYWVLFKGKVNFLKLLKKYLLKINKKEVILHNLVNLLKVMFDTFNKEICIKFMH